MMVKFKPIDGGVSQTDHVTFGSNGSGGHVSLDARVAKLESSVAHIQSDIAEIKTDLRDMRAEYKSDMTQMRTEQKSDMAQMRAEQKSDIADLRTDQRQDFRLLFAALSAVALGLAGLMAKGFGWL